MDSSPCQPRNSALGVVTPSLFMFSLHVSVSASVHNTAVPGVPLQLPPLLHSPVACSWKDKEPGYPQPLRQTGVNRRAGFQKSCRYDFRRGRGYILVRDLSLLLLLLLLLLCLLLRLDPDLNSDSDSDHVRDSDRDQRKENASWNVNARWNAHETGNGHATENGCNVRPPRLLKATTPAPCSRYLAGDYSPGRLVVTPHFHLYLHSHSHSR